MEWVLLLAYLAPPLAVVVGGVQAWKAESLLRGLGGVAMVALGAATISVEVWWWEEYCWETHRPCDGSALDVAPTIGVLACAGLLLALIAVRVVRARRREPHHH